MEDMELERKSKDIVSDFKQTMKLNYLFPQGLYST